MTENSAMDFSRIQETSDGDRAFETELFEMYLEDTADRIQRLDTAIGSGDLELCRREAHTIKGSSANVGATRLQELALRLEGCDPVTRKPDAQALLTKIRDEFELVKSEIGAYLGA
ncbi:MAG: Hpt domain-containing protein [Candidatus Hydrogenedentes bacterium]|nr:Hpt domain-containing protein [Candidatus Hydrogenedentota bacterium]